MSERHPLSFQLNNKKARKQLLIISNFEHGQGIIFPSFFSKIFVQAPEVNVQVNVITFG